MADYEFAYQLLVAPEAKVDGSGMVQHQIRAVAREEGSSGAWAVVPGRNKTFEIPVSELQTVLNMPDGTGPQKQAKNQAYKQALESNINTVGEAVIGWDSVSLEQMLDANDATLVAAEEANTYITVTLGQSYPVQFTI